MASDQVITLNSSNFETTLKKGTVLVDFWAPWCAPCRVQGPIIDELAKSSGDEVTLCKLNIDDNQDIARQYEVMSIPTILIFKDGNVVKQMVGLQEKRTLEAALNALR